MSNFNDRIDIDTSTSITVYLSNTSFGFCNNLDLSVSVFTQPNLGIRYLDNHLLPGIYFYNITQRLVWINYSKTSITSEYLSVCNTFYALCHAK